MGPLGIQSEDVNILHNHQNACVTRDNLYLLLRYPEIYIVRLLREAAPGIRTNDMFKTATLISKNMQKRRIGALKHCPLGGYNSDNPPASINGSSGS